MAWAQSHAREAREVREAGQLMGSYPWELLQDLFPSLIGTVVPRN